MANEELRMLLWRVRLTQRQVARRCGVSEWTLSRWMRREMSEDRRERVLRAVVDLIMERGEIREEPMLLKD